LVSRAYGNLALLTHPWVWPSRRSGALALEAGGVGGDDGAMIPGRRRGQFCLVHGGRTRRRPWLVILGSQSGQKDLDRGPRTCRARRDGRRPPTSGADHSFGAAVEPTDTAGEPEFCTQRSPISVRHPSAYRSCADGCRRADQAFGRPDTDVVSRASYTPARWGRPSPLTHSWPR
jgi:hypothetical protein